MTEPTLAERLQGWVMGAMAGLPAPVLRVLAGGRAVRVDGLELEPEIQLGLLLLRLGGHRDLSTMTPEEAREEIEKNARIFRGTPMEMARIDALAIPGPAGTIAARRYVPAGEARARPLVVYYHGGGWVVGSLDTHDTACRFLAQAADAVVVSVAYRLAPEHRFPAAVEDALAAFRWAAREAAALGGDPVRVAVAGDSAGGTLSAVVSQLASRDGGARPAAQLLIYPMTDYTTRRESYRLFAEGFFLTAAEMDWYLRHYLGDMSLARDPRVSPLLAPSLEGLPPAAILTAGFDVLRDEGEEYAALLRAAGVRVALSRRAGLIHGFANATGVSPASRAAMADGARLLLEALRPA